MIFATDIDGTLLREDGTPHPETISAFREARKKGHKTVIATGRALCRVSNIIKMLENEIDYLVCNNGSIVYDFNNKKDLYLAPIKPKYFLEEFNFAKKHSVSFTMHTNKNSYGWPQSRHTESTYLDPKLVDQIIAFNNKNKDVDFLFNGEYITQLSTFASEEFCNKHFQAIQIKHKNINSVFLTNGVFLDVNPLNHSKWTGLCIIAKKLNLDNSQIVTFGDSGNDYEMIKNARENGYALANSTKDLVKLIKPRIGNNNSNAIAKIIKTLI